VGTGDATGRSVASLPVGDRPGQCPQLSTLFSVDHAVIMPSIQHSSLLPVGLNNNKRNLLLVHLNGRILDRAEIAIVCQLYTEILSV